MIFYFFSTGHEAANSSPEGQNSAILLLAHGDSPKRMNLQILHVCSLLQKISVNCPL